MHGLRADGRARAAALVAAQGEAMSRGGSATGPEVVICPPATLLADLGPILDLPDGPVLGAQDCHPADQGPHTGDLAAPMLADLGCRYVIVGHSERRGDHGESDALVAAKAGAAIRAGLQAIICVGESAADRDAGHGAAVVARQLRGSVPAAAAATNAVIAYEPIWAIGSGRTPTPDEIAAMHRVIRDGLAQGGETRVLYGGSVTPDNARAILAGAEVDGALVGGASLDAAKFWAIVESCP